MAVAFEKLPDLIPFSDPSQKEKLKQFSLRCQTVIKQSNLQLNSSSEKGAGQPISAIGKASAEQAKRFAIDLIRPYLPSEIREVRTQFFYLKDISLNL